MLGFCSFGESEEKEQHELLVDKKYSKRSQFGS